MDLLQQINKQYPSDMHEVARAIIEISDNKIPYNGFDGLKDLIVTLIDGYRRTQQ